MRKRIPVTLGLLVTIGVLAGSVVANNALATQASGITAAVQVPRATVPNEVHINADRITFETHEPTDISVVTLTMSPGATTGWHGHPGVTLVAVTQGTGVLYGSDCSARTYQAGEAFVESGSDPANVFRNESSSPLVFTVTFVAPQARNFRISAPNPGCSAT